MLISVICAVITGRIPQVSDSILKGALESIDLVISLLGMMCFWTGIMKIADKSGLTKSLSRFFSPVLKLLFPDYKTESKAMKSICMNITANLLGLGNAATPMGIAAMKEMQKENSIPGVANNSMVMFVVLNTAALQILPTSMAILRQKHGSPMPLDVIPAVWFASIGALFVGIIMAKTLEKK